MNKVCNIWAKKAFTMIELMVGLVVTIIALSTFFSIYRYALSSERSESIKSDLNVSGDRIINQMADAVRLIGLSNDYSDFSDVDTEIITETDGGDGTDDVSFSFYSPYGGPVTKLTDQSASGTLPDCVIEVLNTSNIDNSLSELRFITRDGLFKGNLDSVSGNQLTVSGITDNEDVSPAGGCDVTIHAGTIVTGENRLFVISFSSGGGNPSLSMTMDGNTLFSLNSGDDAEEYRIPMFILHFMREEEVSGVITRKWEEGSAFDAEKIKEIKAVRMGFILLSKKDKRKSEPDEMPDLDFCIFEDNCYTHTDPNYSARIFKQVVHLKNLDYLHRIDQEM